MIYNNSDWWDFISDDEDTSDELQGDTRQGDCGTLNVWWTELTQASKAQYCDDQYQNETEGVLMSHTVGVGGSTEDYNLGATLVHEVGHWMGLEHTFKNGCGGDGDFVDDTPEVAEANYGDYCYDEVDSCGLS